MPGAADYARLRSSGRCPQCGSAVTDHQPNGERYAYCSDCRKARREERAASREPAKRPPAAPNPKKRSFPKRVRIEIAERDGWRCHYCGAGLVTGKAREWHIDHRVPVSRGGSDDPGNLVAACELDNQRKGDLTEPEYRDWLAGYGADLPDLDQTAWARIGIVRALVCRELLDACPAAATDHSPCETCQVRASEVLQEAHSRGLFTGCRIAALAASLSNETSGKPDANKITCTVCNVIREPIWRALRLGACGSFNA